MTNPKAVLCYVEGRRAFFTTQSLADQWGDDWNDAPYEHNAGFPYEWRGNYDKSEWEVFSVYFDGPWDTPAERSGCNSPWSVENINANHIAWLLPSCWVGEQPPAIQAGTAYEDFRRIVLEFGTLYEPVEVPPCD